VMSFLNLVEGITEREPRGDIGQSGNRSPSRPERAPRQRGVHLDDRHPAFFGLTANWMLDQPVSTPTLRMMRRARRHTLVILVARESGSGCDRDAVAGVDAIGRVLERTDEDECQAQSPSLELESSSR